jgi:hypothetical protein
MIRFWVGYHQLCERLIVTTGLPTERLTVSYRDWSEAERQLERRLGERFRV